MDIQKAQQMMDNFTTEIHNIVDLIEDQQDNFDELDIETWNHIKPNWNAISIDYDAVDGSKKEIKKYYCLYMDIYRTMTALSYFEVNSGFHTYWISETDLVQMEEFLDLLPTVLDEDPIGTYLADLDY